MRIWGGEEWWVVGLVVSVSVPVVMGMTLEILAEWTTSAGSVSSGSTGRCVEAL